MASNIQRWDAAAEKIITGAGLAFALAAGAGKEGYLREARALLKEAIVKALRTENAHTADDVSALG